MLTAHSPVLDHLGGAPESSATHLTHSIELTGLRLCLARQGVLERWESEVEIRARNELTTSGYAKDYDAIVTVNLVGRSSRLALEYERTPKKARDYLRIRQLLEEETAVRHFLYVVPEPNLAAFLLECFNRTAVSLLICRAADFNQPFAEIHVTDAKSGRGLPLLHAL